MDEIELKANLIDRYPAEDHGENSDYDDGTMPENVQALRNEVIGRKIVRAYKASTTHRWGRGDEDLILELDNGTQVRLQDTDDCCAYTALEGFFLNPAAVEHAIMGVGTTGDFTKWFIYAEFETVLTLDVGWSCGNPFYYGYGFHIAVEPIVIDAEVIAADQLSLEK